MAEAKMYMDRGWAWCVVLGSFGMHITVTALAKCFGVLFVDFQETFGCSTWALTSIQGTAMALWLGLAPMSTALAVRFTCRKVVFAGGFISAVGFVISSLSSSVHMFFVFQGVVVGIGYGLAFAPSVVILISYFEKRRGIAVGIAQAGGGIGGIAMPVIIRYLVSEYTLRGSILLQGAIMANVCVCAMLLRPPSFYTCQPLDMIDVKAQDVEDDGRLCDNDSKLLYGYVRQMREIADGRVTENKYYMQDESVEIVQNDEAEDSDDSKAESRVSIKLCEKRRFDYRKYFNVSILKNPLFVIYFIAAIGSEITWQLSFIMLPSLSIARDFSKGDSALLLTIMGVADFTTRMLIGCISDMNVIPRRYIFTATVFLTGVTALLVPFTNSYATLVVGALSYGILGAVNVPLQTLVMADVLGVKNISSAFGITCLFQALGVLGTSQAVDIIFHAPREITFAGCMFDVTGTWNIPFWFSAVFSLTGGAVACLEPLITCRVERRRNDGKNDLKQDSHRMIAF